MSWKKTLNLPSTDFPMKANLVGREPQIQARWEAVRWLNSSPSPKDETFEQYLNKWYHAVPKRHRAFVKQVATLYGQKVE